MKNSLPYLTETGHEYFINWNKKTANISCMDGEGQIDGLPNLSKEDVSEMIETAKILGVDTVVLNTNFGVDIHSHTLKTSKAFANFTINKS